MNIAVVGSGAWGTALAICLCRNGHSVTLWARDEGKAADMRRSGVNPRLTGVALPAELEITGDIACVAGKKLVVMASPSFALRAVSKQVAPHLDRDAVLVSVTKGIEPETMLRMSQVIGQETGHPVVALTGPSHAEEVARGIATGCVAACPDQPLAELVQDVFMNDNFRVYTSPDIVGAELGGALKNVIALCAGVVDGVGLGDNTQAMLITRGLTEIARLGVSMGASRDTFAGLTGVGDLVVTCTSVHSRNRQSGVYIGQGKTPQQAMEAVGAVVEGYYATQSAWMLCQKQGVDMPIVHAAYRVLYEGVSAREAVRELLTRQKKSELEDAGWM